MSKPFPKVDVSGVTRQVLADSPDLMVVSFRFRAGGQGALHQHAHVQSTYVKTGRFAFHLAGKTTEIGPGDSFIIPANTEHGCDCLEDGELIDCFTPRRDDFL